MAAALRRGTLTPPRTPMLAQVPRITLLILVAPVVAGLAGTLLPAFGHLPALGRSGFNLDAWRRLAELPGLATSVRLSFVVGLLTTAVSFAAVIGFCAAWHEHPAFRFLTRRLAPLLAVPHVAIAFGLAFLLTPSGWLLRILSPWATGLTRPPDWHIVQDPHGLCLILGLVTKEIPFLLLMTLAAIGQTNAPGALTVARTLGYRPVTAWLKVVLPTVYPQIRLPIFAVLAFGVSVVDVALVLGPTTPAPLAVRLVRMFNDPDLTQRFTASAGALLQCAVVAAVIALWCVLEAAARRLGSRWLTSGHRGTQATTTRWTSGTIMAACTLAVTLSVAALALWSVAGAWRFPAALPSTFTPAHWLRHVADLRQPLLNTLALAAGSTLPALALAIGVLEHEARSGLRSAAGSTRWLYLPLVLPQVAFLFGAQVLLAAAGLDGRLPALIWIHLVFVFPYVFLSLADPYRAWDERFGRTALCLGASPVRVLLRIKGPMLLRPIATAAAVGFAVSVGLYLPTLFAGGGRFPTLTTEAVAQASGADPRQIGVCVLLQMILPLAAFALATGFPAWRFRNHQGMQPTPTR